MALNLFNKRRQGYHYESLAEQYLQRQGLKPIARNVHCRGGELDLIMKDGNCWVFIEVKYRAHNRFGTAVEAIDWRKQQRIKRTALFWLHSKGLSAELCQLRFDVVAIQGADHQITWLTNTLVEE
ncbi:MULTISPECIES: YraN family protein [unclassified Photobacterium]|uniref:YraN family protein n=1 Tax=unclassified Photobacterium TaxID=2628852 RepID=UPI001B8AE136|nr:MULTISPECIES: YraN family protein [unclassified Photobacterium]MDO6706434.1 YraN family protein [Photobacterium sp. 1_MG-2023]QUJ67100.1 YraN family protein [Photobacterium sp. GJ3]